MLNKPSGYISATTDEKDKIVLDLIDKNYLIFEPFPVGRLDKDTEGLLVLTNDGQLAHRILSPKKHIDKTYYAKVLGKVDHEDIEKFRQGVTLDDGYKTMSSELKILNISEEFDLINTNKKIELFDKIKINNETVVDEEKIDSKITTSINEKINNKITISINEKNNTELENDNEIKTNIESISYVSEIELTIREGKFHQVKRMFESVGKKVIYLKRISMGKLELDKSLNLGEYRELSAEEVKYLEI
ncbi:MAG: pseudouridine synthase [Clostridioides sp.]|nr:pseudouridine synthase [Clostridioides sp.]